MGFNLVGFTTTEVTDLRTCAACFAKAAPRATSRHSSAARNRAGLSPGSPAGLGMRCAFEFLFKLVLKRQGLTMEPAASAVFLVVHP